MTSLIQPVSCRRARFFRYYHSIARRPLTLTLHEPPLRPPPRSRPRPRSALVSRTRTRTRTIGFMVPTRDCEVLGALHEPGGNAEKFCECGAVVPSSDNRCLSLRKNSFG